MEKETIGAENGFVGVQQAQEQLPDEELLGALSTQLEKQAVLRQYYTTECQPVKGLQPADTALLSDSQSIFSECSPQMSKYFKNALIFDKSKANLRFELNHIYRQLIPRWHFAMLNDVERNDAFQIAIKRAVYPGCTVLDVGAGSGLLAMMAARQGAHFITSCEMLQPLAYLAKRIVALNGFKDQIKIVPKKSQDLLVGRDLANRANILITETVDCGLVGEGILPIIRHARQSLLTPEATIIPARAVIKFSLLESSMVHNLNFVSNAADFDVSPFNIFSTMGYFPVRLWIWPHRLLSQPSTAFEFDFRVDSLTARQRQMSVQVERSGTLHGIVFWFELDLGNGVVFNNAVDNNKSHWMQAVQCFETPIAVQQDELLELIIRQDDANINFKITKPLSTSSSSPINSTKL